MAGYGPPPSSRRQTARGLSGGRQERLPAAGRSGDPPAFPLSRPSARERELWARLWALPQAVMWERQHVDDVVGRYCRLAVKAERSGSSSRLLNEVRQLEDRIGLSPVSLMRLRWVIEDDGELASSSAGDGQVLSIRERIVARDED